MYMDQVTISTDSATIPSTTSGVNVTALERIDIDDLLPAALRRDSPFRQLSVGRSSSTSHGGARPPVANAKIVVNPHPASELDQSIESSQVK